MVDWHKNLYPYLQICSALRGVKLESVLPKNLYYRGSKGKSVENLWISFERWTWKTFENSTFLGIFLWFIYKMIEKSLGWIFFSSEVPYCPWHCALSLNKDSSFLILPITFAPLVQFGWNLKWPTFIIHHWWWLDFQGQKGHTKARWVTFWPLFEIFSIHSNSPF